MYRHRLPLSVFTVSTGRTVRTMLGTHQSRAAVQVGTKLILRTRRSSCIRSSPFVKRRTTTNTNTTTTTNTKSTATTKVHAGVNVEEVASQHGVRLTQTEVKCLRQQLDLNRDGLVSLAELQKSGKTALERRWTRELCLSAIEKPTTAVEHSTQRLLKFLDYSGTVLFAVVGCQLAGEENMNLIGCTLVGCIAAMGGGTLNNLLYGSSALLLDKPGVFWIRQPSYLVLSLVSSVVTFYTWPILCRKMAKTELEQFIGKEKLNRDGSCNRESFLQACRENVDFRRSVATALHLDPITTVPELLFAAADSDGRGSSLSLTEMETLVAKQFDASPIMYGADSLALAAFAAVAVNGAVQRGLHPIVAATSGVTICFGGILRDVLCGRELAIGGQSYAFATGAGAAVYVLLRELRLCTGWPIPLLARIVSCFAVTVGLRVFEYSNGKPLLSPMHLHHHLLHGKDDNNDPPGMLRTMLSRGLRHQSTVDWLQKPPPSPSPPTAPTAE